MRRVRTNGPIYGDSQRLQVEWFGQQSDLQPSRSLHHVPLRKRGDDHHWRRVTPFSEPIDDVESGCAWHPDIGQNEIEAFRGLGSSDSSEGVSKLAPAADGRDLVAALA